MSFSQDVKKELCRLDDIRAQQARHCAIAEIAAMINACGRISHDTDNGYELFFQTENKEVAKKYFTLLQKTFKISGEITVRKNRLMKNMVYAVNICDPVIAEKLLNATGLRIKSKEGLIVEKNINPMIVKSECCKRAYIRGAFLSVGSVSDPVKAYHLEFVYADNRLGMALCALINSYGLNAKILLRKGHFVVYVKEGENISDLLKIMEAHRSLLLLENVRVEKDVRNNVNRKVNCETANISKTIKASVRQIQDIQYISKTKGLQYLSEQLEEVARIRLLYDEATLTEIGAMLSPPVGKSGVNHRLRKICEIADNLRGDQL